MKVLIVVDCQNDFLTGSLGTPEAQAILPIVREKIEKADEETLIIFTIDTHFEDYLNTLEGKNLPVAHCIHGTFGWQINNSIMITASKRAEQINKGYSNYLIFDKNTFGSSELACYLYDENEYEQNLESIELCGVCTGICVISNALIIKAHLPEVPIIVDASACACITPESHLRALESMKTCQIEVINE